MFKKKMICLAYSRKKPGICIAGKDAETGDWIRPVTNKEGGALELTDIRYSDGTLPELLDIIEIYFEKDIPKSFQPENKLIAPKRWEKIGKIDSKNMAKLLDDRDVLFHNTKYTSSLKYVDLNSNPIGYSLCLIAPETLKFTFKKDEAKLKEKIRAVFLYRNSEYDLSVTDIAFENKMKTNQHAETLLIYNPQNYYFCVSLGEPWAKVKGNDEYCHKLVAGIIKT